ncbi:unnamed protein product [Fusarium graminearum]|nr:unnamed protein product [Fusarium graminearum]
MRFFVAVIFAMTVTVLHHVHGKTYHCTGLRRNADSCSSHDHSTEYRCMADENSLHAIMSCVSIKGGAEKHFCRKSKDGSVATPENYFEYDKDSWARKQNMCVTPRQALLSISRNDCIECNLTGLLLLCPMDDPNFLSCLCEYHATDEHLQCLSQCFKFDTVLGPPTCSKSLLKKRNEPDITVPGYGNPWELERHGLKFAIYSNGVVAYIRTDNTVYISSFTLPYFDQPNQDTRCRGESFKRCYISPVSAEPFCWNMCLNEAYTPPPQPTYASFTQISEATERPKTLSNVSKTQSSATVSRIEVPTQDFIREDNKEDENNDKQKNGGSADFQGRYPSRVLVSVLILVGFNLI